MRARRRAEYGTGSADADPRNEEYVRELLSDLYTWTRRSAWFGGGLTRARALVEEVPMRQRGWRRRRCFVNDSREEHSGAHLADAARQFCELTGMVGTARAPASMKMRAPLEMMALAWLLSVMGHAQSLLTQAQALDRYLETHQGKGTDARG